MTLSLRTLTPADTPAAAVLLAARYRADRDAAPELPVAFAHHDAAAEALRDALGEPGAHGMAAFRDGDLAGFLIAAPVFAEPRTVLASYVRPRSAVIAYAGHATEAAGRYDTLRVLYAALSGELVRAGI